MRDLLNLKTAASNLEVAATCMARKCPHRLELRSCLAGEVMSTKQCRLYSQCDELAGSPAFVKELKSLVLHASSDILRFARSVWSEICSACCSKADVESRSV